MMLTRILKEPLLHFALLAALILGSYGLFQTEQANAPERISVTTERIEQLAAVFAKTWQRPPNDVELKRLIDEFVKEEIYSREAVKLGLDRDDTVIRRRLRQKMEFLNEAAADQLVPTDAELTAYLSANGKNFEIDPAVAFEQVFLNPQRHGDRIEQEAGSVLEVLMATPGVDAATLGDSTMLPAEVPLSSKAIVAQTFGPEFADAIVKLKPGGWAGPIQSGFGYHLVRVTEHRAGRVPELSKVRDVVQREWKNTRRRELEDARLVDLLKVYDVKIETASQDGQP